MDRHYSFISIWLQLELCAMAVLLTKGEIRCYCDAPHCVATGYMCKSPFNACFTKVVDPHIMNSPLTHGCLDLVTTSAGVCLNRPAEDLAAGPSMIQCCHDDMCNYRGVHDLAHAKGEYYDHGNRHRLDNSRHLITKVQDLASAREVWFRAAVIAVPVAGGLILALLVVLALRMLRSENRHLRTQRHQTLAHLQRSFQTHHCTTKKAPPSTKLSTGHAAPELSARPDSSCPVCDKMHVPVLGNDGFLSLVHWGTYRGFEKQEFI